MTVHRDEVADLVEGSRWNSMVLPSPLAELEQCFGALEAGLPLLLKRHPSGMLPYKLVRDAVEAAQRKSFTTEHLGQIITLLPETCRIHGADRPDKVVLEPPRKLSYEELFQRRKAFRKALTDHIEKSYKIYLDGGGKPSEFNLENHVNPISPIQFPSSGQVYSPSSKSDKDDLNDKARVPLSVMLKTIDSSTGGALKRKRGIIGCNTILMNDKVGEKQKRIRGLKGLPLKLLEKVTERAWLENQMSPEVMREKHQAASRAALPNVFDYIYLYLRSNRKTRCDFETLVQLVVDRNMAMSSGVTTRSVEMDMTRNQLRLISTLIPEWCKIENSSSRPGQEIFVVNTSDATDISTLRKKLAHNK